MSAMVDIKDVAASASASSSFTAPFQGTMGGSSRSYGRSSAGGTASNPWQNNTPETSAVSATAKADNGGVATASAALSKVTDFLTRYSVPILVVLVATFGALLVFRNQQKGNK